MKTQIALLITFSAVLISGCSKDSEQEKPQEEIKPDVGEIYFPPLDSNTWEMISTQELNWNITAEQQLHSFLEEKGTKAFLILKNGKIAVEEYYGTFKKDSIWYWASAGKTLTSFTIGIAQENGLLDIDDSTSAYLGNGWTSATTEQENSITIRNQLTMTSGLKNNVFLFSCISPNCLQYETDAGNRWSYHNGPYTLLQSVVGTAAEIDFETYYNTVLRNKIGMDGQWVPNGNNNLYFSTARSMARFGLLNLNEGKWDDETVLGDSKFLDDMKTTSQDLNKSYGYLWWLNGKESHMGTSSQQVFTGELAPNAPDDMYAALGKNDQKLYIVPSKGLVIVRMGEDAGESQLGPSSFDNELWKLIDAVID